MAHPSGETSRAVTVAVALILGVGIVLNWAPWQGLKTYFTAEIVGLVAVSRCDSSADVYHAQLEDGRILDLQPRAYGRSTTSPSRYPPLSGDESRDGAMEGDLLIAGERPSRWFTTAHRWDNLNPDPWLLDPVFYRLSQTKGIHVRTPLISSRAFACLQPQTSMTSFAAKGPSTPSSISMPRVR